MDSKAKSVNKVGRPSNFSPEKLDSICRSLADGLPFKYACRINGISEDTGEVWRKKYPEFLGRTQAAHAIGVELYMKAAKDQGNAWRLLKSIARGDFTDEETVNLNDQKAPDLSNVPDEDMIACLRGKVKP
jgi:hypothetical protein